MPKSKKQEVAKTTTTVAEAPKGTPYQLDRAQVKKAVTSLVAHMNKAQKEAEDKSEVKNLAADEDEPAQSQVPIFLTIASKQALTKDPKRLKVNKITLPHSIRGEGIRIGLIVKDPQREYKNLVAHDSFPEDLRNKIARVVGIGKLKKKYNTFESKLQLFTECDVWLADDRILDILSNVLGSTIYKKHKNLRPTPIAVATQSGKNEEGKRPYVTKEPKALAKEIEDGLRSTTVQMSISRSATIRVGLQSQKAKEIQENIDTAVNALTGKFITNGWRNIDRFSIKGPKTVALPIWSAAELWASESNVLDEPWKHEAKTETKLSEKKRKFDEWAQEMLDDDEYAERQARIEEANKAKAKKNKHKSKPIDKEALTISKENRKRLKNEALQPSQTPLIAN